MSLTRSGENCLEQKFCITSRSLSIPDLIEEERELIIARVTVLLKHPPPELSPLVHQHLANVAIGGVIIEESCDR